jgi:hypothetical protein
MALPEDYWSSFEHRIDTFDEYIEAIRTISAYQAATWRPPAHASCGAG